MNALANASFLLENQAAAQAPLSDGSSKAEQIAMDNASEAEDEKHPSMENVEEAGSEECQKCDADTEHDDDSNTAPRTITEECQRALSIGALGAISVRQNAEGAPDASEEDEEAMTEDEAQHCGEAPAMVEESGAEEDDEEEEDDEVEEEDDEEDNGDIGDETAAVATAAAIAAVAAKDDDDDEEEEEEDEDEDEEAEEGQEQEDEEDEQEEEENGQEEDTMVSEGDKQKLMSPSPTSLGAAHRQTEPRQNRFDRTPDGSPTKPGTLCAGGNMLERLTAAFSAGDGAGDIQKNDESAHDDDDIDDDAIDDEAEEEDDDHAEAAAAAGEVEEKAPSRKRKAETQFSRSLRRSRVKGAHRASTGLTLRKMGLQMGAKLRIPYFEIDSTTSEPSFDSAAIMEDFRQKSQKFLFRIGLCATTATMTDDDDDDDDDDEEQMTGAVKVA